jgi:hypothetical protein
MTTETRVLWTDHEWQLITNALLEINPSLLGSTVYVALGDGSELRAAMAKALPIERHRSVPVRGGKSAFNRKLLEIFMAMRAKAASLGFAVNTDAAPSASAEEVEADEGAEAEEAQEREELEQAAEVKQTLAVQTKKRGNNSGGPGSRIFWNEDEWRILAQWLSKRHPRMLKAHTAEELDVIPSDVKTAQTLLAPNRQKQGQIHAGQLRTKLFAALQLLKAERAASTITQPANTPISQEWTERMAQAEAGHDVDAGDRWMPAPPAATATGPTPDPVAEAAAQVARTEAGRIKLPSEAPAAASEVNLYEAAFAPLLKPFMTLFAAEISKMLVPQLTAALKAEMDKTLVQSATQLGAAVRAIAVQPTAPAHGPTVGTGHLYEPPVFGATEPAPKLLDKPLPFLRPPTPVQAPRRPSVGILGNRNTYKDELQKEFPEVEILCIDTHKKIPTIANCTRAVSMISFVSHMADKRLKTATGLRYVPLNGTLSDLKRVIAGWITSGALLPGNAIGEKRSGAV